jgi:RNA polymerase sigma factor (TIGR02999 family)
VEGVTLPPRAKTIHDVGNLSQAASARYAGDMSRVPEILNAIDNGDALAAQQLLPLVYDELRTLAAAKLAHERPGQTLDATALVHEAYIRLVAGHSESQWQGKAHFFACAAEAMRRILVDRARHKQTSKGGGNCGRVALEDRLCRTEAPSEDVLAIDEALTELEVHEPQAAQLVKLRYFAGLSHQEAAAVLGISRRAADRLWILARAWLYRRIAAV